MDTFFEVVQQMKLNTKVHFVVLGQGSLKEKFMKKQKPEQRNFF